jgi:hypothetical protein
MIHYSIELLGILKVCLRTDEIAKNWIQDGLYSLRFHGLNSPDWKIFQVKVDKQAEEYDGFAAIIRWNSEDYGLD